MAPLSPDDPEGRNYVDLYRDYLEKVIDEVLAES